MSFINKVKNFFYEDIEEDDEEFEAREAAKREARLRKEAEKRRKQEQKIQEVKESKPANDDLSERELFKSEKTFNFPMDIGDDIFDITETMPSAPSIKKEEKKEESRSQLKEEMNIYARPNRTNSVPSIRTTYTETPTKSENTDTKFHPTPVISPVYGILDKNYTVEDVVDKNLSKTKEFSLEKKSVDFDTVRNRAYKELDDEIEATLTKTKDLFYNLDDEKEESEQIEEYIEETNDKSDDVIITYEGEEESVKEEVPEVEEETPVENELDEEEDLSPDVEIPVVEESVKPKKKRRSKTTDTEEPEEDKEKEDLFNLIDNMYNDEEDEEEED